LSLLKRNMFLIYAQNEAKVIQKNLGHVDPTLPFPVSLREVTIFDKLYFISVRRVLSMCNKLAPC